MELCDGVESVAVTVAEACEGEGRGVTAEAGPATAVAAIPLKVPLVIV